MAYKLILPSYFEEEIDELYRFYESRKQGWGTDFLVDLNQCLEGILANPSSWQFLHTKETQIRRAITSKKNPQAIILYKIEGNRIFVTDLKDSKSDWKK